MIKQYVLAIGWLRHREWDYTDFGKEQYQRQTPAKMEITIATYNILADNLMKDNYYLYSQCDEEYLTWDYRRKNLVEEISHLHPDVRNDLQALFSNHTKRKKKLIFSLGPECHLIRP